MTEAMITLDTYKQQHGVSEAFNLQELFNGRVGDEQVPLVVKFLERGKAQQFEDGLVPFMSGFVGNLDDSGKVTAETGEPVSYTGSRDEIVGLGMIKMNLPGTMFPQEGYFYGFLGLETPDHSKRVSTFSVWFHVYNGNPDMFVNREPFRSELQKELDRSELLIDNVDEAGKAKLKELEDKVNDLITNKNFDLGQLESRLDTDENSLKLLEDKIKADGLLTAADLDKALADINKRIQDGLDQLNSLGDELSTSSLEDVDGGIQPYMVTTLDTAKAGIDKTKFNLIFGTDYHYDIGSTYNQFGGDSIDNMDELWESGLRKVLNATSFDNADAVVFGGDNVDQPAVHDIGIEKKIMVKQLRDFLDTASSSADAPVFVLKGNHDGNYNQSAGKMTIDNVITDKEFETLYRSNVANYGEVRNGNSNYFYQDFADKKVRLIGLDTYDLPETSGDNGTLTFNRFSTSGLQQAQLDWLANTALQVPDGTTVVITMHHPVDGTLSNDSKVINHDVLLQILSDFVTGTGNTVTGTNTSVPVKVTYTFAKAGLIAGVLSGHYHYDSNVVKNGINFIQTRCSLTAGDNVINKKRWDYFGTALEDAFDIVTVDSTAKTITLKRVGAGSEDPAYATRQFNFGGDQ